MADKRAATITTPLGDVAFVVTAFRGREALSELFELTVDVAASGESAVAFDQLLGKGVTVSLEGAEEAAPRPFHGLVRSVVALGTERGNDTAPRNRYRFTLVPALWALTRRRRSRVFQQLSVPDILKAVLTGVDAKFSLQGTYEPRNYCTQYRETDFAFASRLMEEEGIFYCFAHADGSHQLVVGDAPSAHPATSPAAAAYATWKSGATLPEDAVYAWQREQHLTAGKVALWDHHFELPGKPLDAEAQVPATVQMGEVSHALRVGGNDAWELYDYPGGYAKRFDGIGPGGGEQAAEIQKVFQDNLRTATLRVGAVEAEALRAEGQSTCRQLSAGHKVTLTNHPDASGDYVLLSVVHEATFGDGVTSGDTAGFSYTNTFRALPAALPYRPPLLTPRPTVAGCQTAVVVGPSGDEIFTDKYGRVKVQFHWDREGKKDAASSCWVRVATLWAGRQWGAIHIPRVGQEVIVDFVEGDPDRPIVVGSVYNAEQMPPYTLPDNKTQSGIKSRSSLKGTAETFNELRFEDKKDAEQVFVQAQKDLDVVVKQHRTTTIWGNDTTKLTAKPNGEADKGDQTITLDKGDQTTTLTEGNQTVTLTKGNQTIELKDGNRTLDVKGKETITVRDDRALTVSTGNETITVEKGNRTIAVKTGNESVTLDMGNYSLTAKMGNVAVKANVGSITLEAMQEIELKVGGNSIKIDQMGVTVKGMMVKVEGQVMTEVKGLMTQIKADAMLTAKGAITMIN